MLVLDVLPKEKLFVFKTPVDKSRRGTFTIRYAVLEGTKLEKAGEVLLTFKIEGQEVLGLARHSQPYGPVVFLSKPGIDEQTRQDIITFFTDFYHSRNSRLMGLIDLREWKFWGKLAAAGADKQTIQYRDTEAGVRLGFSEFARYCGAFEAKIGE